MISSNSLPTTLFKNLNRNKYIDSNVSAYNAIKGYYMYTLMSHTVHIPVKNSHFNSFLVASGIEYTGSVIKKGV